MYDLPVIGYLAMRKELWDRQGANIASRWKEMCGEKLFPRPKRKSRGNNPIKPFLQFQITCVQPGFLLFISFINKLWLLEIYLLKGAMSLSEETETVFTALMRFGGMKSAMRNTKKSVG